MIQDLLDQLYGLINNSEDIQVDEIPEYHLYISQLEEFFDKKLKKGSGDEEERKAISRTMIQNYIKDGLLMPPDGKSYNRSHIILLTFIYNLKYILSIRDICSLLSSVQTGSQNEDNDAELKNIYENYLDLKQNLEQNLIVELETLADKIDSQPLINKREDNEYQVKIKLFLFISTLVTEANQRKKIAEFLIEKYFTAGD